MKHKALLVALVSSLLLVTAASADCVHELELEADVGIGNDRMIFVDKVWGKRAGDTWAAGGGGDWKRLDNGNIGLKQGWSKISSNFADLDSLRVNSGCKDNAWRFRVEWRCNDLDGYSNASEDFRDQERFNIQGSSAGVNNKLSPHHTRTRVVLSCDGSFVGKSTYVLANWW